MEFLSVLWGMYIIMTWVYFLILKSRSIHDLKFMFIFFKRYRKLNKQLKALQIET